MGLHEKAHFWKLTDSCILQHCMFIPHIPHIYFDLHFAIEKIFLSSL